MKHICKECGIEFRCLEKCNNTRRILKGNVCRCPKCWGGIGKAISIGDPCWGGLKEVYVQHKSYEKNEEVRNEELKSEI